MTDKSKMIELDITVRMETDGTMHFTYNGQNLRAPACLFKRSKKTGKYWVNANYAKRNLTR